MILELGGEQIPVRVEKTQGRKMALRFRDHEPILLVRTPSGKLNRQTESFLQQNQKWILKHYQNRKKLFARRRRFQEDIKNGLISYMGEPHRIVYQTGPKRWVKQENKQIIIQYKAGESEDMLLPLLYGGLRALAKQHLSKRTYELAEYTSSSFQNIRIKDHKSKWGSCSGKRNINLNWHLILLSPALIDYVIIHELMHLREMNHSQKFWKWVETYYPKYKIAEKQLTDHQWLIGILEE